MKKGTKYLEIAKHYAGCLERHGDSHLGVDWPREVDLDTRHQVMFDMIKLAGISGTKKVSVLDFGCGLSHFYDFLVRKKLHKGVEYTGLDISKGFVDLAKKKYPQNKYLCKNVLSKGATLPKYDFIAMNGVFTQKRNLSNAEMFDFLKRLIRFLYAHANHGIAFNVMSHHVDWKKRAAFHLGFDPLSKFLCAEISRNHIYRHDYGLYEYTVYIYKK